jgi:hypothetical protein
MANLKPVTQIQESGDRHAEYLVNSTWVRVENFVRKNFSCTNRRTDRVFLKIEMRVNCDDNGDFAASGEFFFAARERLLFSHFFFGGGGGGGAHRQPVANGCNRTSNRSCCNRLRPL